MSLPPPVLVVGAVVVRDGRVLAARRTRPADLAGQWEFPGGKVEPGEEPVSALVREFREELGATVTVGLEVGDGRPWPISERYVLRLYVCSLGEAQPSPGPDHDTLRWLSADELDSVDWLESDRQALGAVRLLLGGDEP